MKQEFQEIILETMQAEGLGDIHIIQELWSGYGQIVRIKLHNAAQPSVIVKHISLPEKIKHPRGWNTNTSHLRKLKSYEVEMHWYKYYTNKVSKVQIPSCYGSYSTENEKLIILEDLDLSDYTKRKQYLELNQAKVVVKWLAQFHAQFINTNPDGLWPTGTYWHLATRPDEYSQMEKGLLKDYAQKLDLALNSVKFQTIVHGDAKVANFCFSEDLQKVAAVDFQYVGGGCGMKDLTYFMGSCLTGEECSLWEPTLLDYYFENLRNSIDDQSSINFEELETEWRKMYALAWADFYRFLYGWMPNHRKFNSYGAEQVNKAIDYLNQEH